jgi:hypothetical protein
MISTNSHYGIDIVIGMIVAHYFFLITNSYVHAIDSKTFIDYNELDRNDDEDLSTEIGDNTRLEIVKIV